MRTALLFVAALAICLLVYVIAAVPRAWFPNASAKTWSAAQLRLVRGNGALVDGELIVGGTDANDVAVISVVTSLRSADYAAIECVCSGFAEDAGVKVVWSNDYSPAQINSAMVSVESGRALPAVVANDPAWIGNITGIAVAVHGPLSQPVHIHGIVAKPMGALEVLSDRAHEWLTFEGWSGTSINTIAGGDDVQQLPLPLLLASAVALAVAAAALATRQRGASRATLAVTGATLFLVAWLALDARWTWNLARQSRATAGQFAGKDPVEKHQAADDAALFDFVQKALKVMPAQPVRIIVASDATYFRGRAAYHLYPHSAYFDASSNALPAVDRVRAGDWMLVWQRRGIQYNSAEGKLRWDGGSSVSAELKLLAPGAALFVIR